MTQLLMKRVTYGIKSCAYHTVRAMQETTKLNPKSRIRRCIGETYAAALYAKIGTDERNQCKLLAAKTRVAPVKQISLLRLELCAALLAAQLMKSGLEALSHTDFKISKIYGWSDSTIAFNWIADLPRRWNCFVGNRVAQIQIIDYILRLYRLLPGDMCLRKITQLIVHREA